MNWTWGSEASWRRLWRRRLRSSKIHHFGGSRMDQALDMFPFNYFHTDQYANKLWNQGFRIRFWWILELRRSSWGRSQNRPKSGKSASSRRSSWRRRLWSSEIHDFDGSWGSISTKRRNLIPNALHSPFANSFRSWQIHDFDGFWSISELLELQNHSFSWGWRPPGAPAGAPGIHLKIC